MSNFIDLKTIFKNSPNIIFHSLLFFCALYETISGNIINAITIRMQIAIRKLLLIKLSRGGKVYTPPK